MKKSTPRQSNFELLRIISMFMIVGLHYFNASMGGALRHLSPGEPNYYVTFLLESLFIVSVGCFILITGYFSINKKSVELNKAIDLIVQMVFYGLLFYFIAVAFGWLSFSVIEMVKAAFPILIGRKWFIQVFVILYLLIPFLNTGLNNMDKKTYQSFLIIMLLMFSVYPSFLPSPPVTDSGYGIITFVLFYAVGGYIRKHYQSERSKSFYLRGYLLTSVITFVFSIAVDFLVPGQLGRVWGYNFVFNIFGSIFLFLLFSKLKIQSDKINYYAGFVLGVYFVRTDPSLNNFIYERVLQTHNFWHSPWFIIHAILSISVVYIVSTIIDMGRKWIFDKIGEKTVPYLKENGSFLFKRIPYESVTK